MAELISPAAERHALAHTSELPDELEQIAQWTLANMPSPQMMSGLAEVRLLEALIAVGGARTALEIGSFTGAGAVAIARAMGPLGRLVTLERDPERVEIARRHIEQSGYAERIDLVVGDAITILPTLEGPFDLVYIDAYKPEYPLYYEAVVPMLATRGVIVADNLFRGGAVLDERNNDRGTRGMREFTERVQADERTSNVLLTIGDGVMLAWPRPQA